MPQKHSTPIHGLMDTARSPLFQGRFGRLFRSLTTAIFEDFANYALGT